MPKYNLKIKFIQQSHIFVKSIQKSVDAREKYKLDAHVAKID